MRHILQVINQTGDQATAEITTDKEAEQTKKGVHEADVMADAGDDGLLAVWTHGRHWSWLKHLPLHNGHGGGCTRCADDRGRVTRSKVTGPWTVVLCHHMRKMPRGRVVTTRDVRWNIARLYGFIWWRSIIWRQGVTLWRCCHYWSTGCRNWRLPIFLLKKRGTGAPWVRRRGVTGHVGSQEGGQRRKRRSHSLFLLYPYVNETRRTFPGFLDHTLTSVSTLFQ